MPIDVDRYSRSILPNILLTRSAVAVLVVRPQNWVPRLARIISDSCRLVKASLWATFYTAYTGATWLLRAVAGNWANWAVSPFEGLLVVDSGLSTSVRQRAELAICVWGNLPDATRPLRNGTLKTSYQGNARHATPRLRYKNS